MKNSYTTPVRKIQSHTSHQTLKNKPLLPTLPTSKIATKKANAELTILGILHSDGGDYESTEGQENDARIDSGV